METAVTSNQPAASTSQATTAEKNKHDKASNGNSCYKEEASAVVVPQLFRPINFEGNSPTPPTPEGIESTASKSTLGNGSESGSESAQDSAYGSDNHQPLRPDNSQASAHKKIAATLQNKALWKDFKRIGNEMIVTKPGR